MEANGEDLDIFGRNSTGKTRIADGWHWLLFGKDSRNQSSFDIKPLDANGNAVHNVESTVEGTIRIDGRTTVLKRVFKEKWSRMRGRIEAEFTGHTSNFYIDDVPTAENLYIKAIAELIGSEETFRLITSPTAFPSLPWQKARAILMDVCGDLRDEDVIDSDPALAPLHTFLGKGRTFEDHKKVVHERRKKINEEIQTLPIRIDEVKCGLPEIEGLDRKIILADIAAYEKALSDAKLRLQGVDTGGKIAELSKKLAGINADINALENKHYIQGMAEVNKLSQKIAEITANAEQSQRKVDSIKAEIELKKKRVEAVEADLSRLREKWTAIDAEVFQDTTESVCVTCDQALPENRVREAREKAHNAFNQSKSERLTEIDTRGKGLAAEKAKYLADMEALEKSVQTVGGGEPAPDLYHLTSERDRLKAAAEDYSLIREREDLLNARAAYEEGIKAEKQGVQINKQGAEVEIHDLKIDLDKAKAEGDKFRQREQGEVRIERLKEQEKNLGAEYEDLEKEIYLIEKFIRRKVKMLESTINNKFEVVKWKLFDYHVNGALNDQMCELTVNGVGYNSNLNSGGRINAGLDVCRTLMHHYGLMVPVFVDNAETVCDLIKLDAQMIRLIVSEKDERLRVEMVKKQETLFSGKAA